MAEIAKLGIDIDASSATTAAAKMRQFGDTSAEAATKAQRGVKSFEEALEALRSGERAKDAELIKNALGKTGDAAQTAQQKAQGLPTALKLISTELGILGPAGSVAAQGLNTLLTIGGPLGLAMTALGGALAFATSRISDARAKVKEFQDVINADIDRKQGLVKVNKDIETQIRLLRAADPELERIKIQYEESIEAARGAFLMEKSAAELRAEQTNKLGVERLNAANKEKEAIQAQITAADFRIAKIGVTGDALIQLNLAETLHNNLMNDALQKHAALANEVDRRASAEANLQRAQNLVQSGQQGRTDFQNQFGVTFDIERAISGNRLADQFAATFNTFKNDPRAQGPLTEAFKSLVTQAVQVGVPDIPELLSEKIGAANFGRLRASLGDDLKSALDASAQSGQQWGASFDAEVKKYTAGAAEVGARTEELRKRMEDLERSVVRDLALTLDVSQPLSAAQQVQRQYEQLRAQLAVPIPVTVATYASGSPIMPFSDYFNTYVPKQLAGISGLSPEVAVNIPDFTGKVDRLRQIEQEQRSIQNSFNAGINLGGSDIGRNNRLLGAPIIQRLSEEAERIKFELGAEAFKAQQQGRAGGSGGGGGGPTVIMDFTNAQFHGSNFQQVVDDDLMPALERTMIRATGQSPTFRIQN